jgi:hypothetical protein
LTPTQVMTARFAKISAQFDFFNASLDDDDLTVGGALEDAQRIDG